MEEGKGRNGDKVPKPNTIQLKWSSQEKEEGNRHFHLQIRGCLNRGDGGDFVQMSWCSLGATIGHLLNEEIKTPGKILDNILEYDFLLW